MLTPLQEKVLVGLVVFASCYVGYSHVQTSQNPALCLAVLATVSHAIAHVAIPYIAARV